MFLEAIRNKIREQFDPKYADEIMRVIANINEEEKDKHKEQAVNNEEINKKEKLLLIIILKYIS